jgi:TrmH family RNA methyltransferase
MGTITTTRPLPMVLAAVYVNLRDVAQFRMSPTTTLLVAEKLQNPDNLGMVLRTADAAGIEAVVVTGTHTDPLHKNCVRAARGAVGRIPLLVCADLAPWLEDLRATGFHVFGATAHAETTLFQCAMRPPLTVVIGNEQAGISQNVLDVCTNRVQIPMAPGQDSLNVGVATGVLLYEIVRQRMQEGSAAG